MYYHNDASKLRFMATYTKLIVVGVFSLLLSIIFLSVEVGVSPVLGEAGLMGDAFRMINIVSKLAEDVTGIISIFCLMIGISAYYLTPECTQIVTMVRYGLYNPCRGNPFHLQDGELLPRIDCQKVGEGLYDLVISAQESVTVDTIVNSAPAISGMLNRRFQRYAVVQTTADEACRYVTFRLDDVKVDRSITYSDLSEMKQKTPTKLVVDRFAYIDLTTSGSMLFAGKTRSGKTTGVISLLMQVLQCGRDEYGSEIVIIDPKQAELSRLPHTVTLDKDGEARAILQALKDYTDTIKQRQKILNDYSEKCGDAMKWWDIPFHPSFLFVDEYVACRSIFPKKAAKDSDYCLDTFDGLIKRIITMGASAGCFAIISIAEASVQEGGLPSMLRAAMSTRVLFRPTLPEGRLIWDSEKLEDFSAGRVYGPGDAWFSSTDGLHDTVSYVHFPQMDFPVYKALGQCLQDYYHNDDAAPSRAQQSDGVACAIND